MATDKNKYRTSTEQNAEAGKEKIASQTDTQNGLKEPLVTNTPKEDKSMVDSADQTANKEFKKELDAKAAKEEAKIDIHDELYETLKSGDEFPGYTIIPAERAHDNPTVEKVIMVKGQDAVVKLKATSRKSFTDSQLGRNLGLIEGQAAKDIEEGRA